MYIKTTMIALVALLTACSGTNPLPVVQRVNIPVPACPGAVLDVVYERPHLFVQDLKEGDSPAKVMKYYDASLYQLVGYSKELESKIDSLKQACTPNE